MYDNKMSIRAQVEKDFHCPKMEEITYGTQEIFAQYVKIFQSLILTSSENVPEDFEILW